MNINNIAEMQKSVTTLKVEFINLTEPYREALWRYCLKITGNAIDAEDLVQDTMLRAFAKLGYLGQALNTKAYLFRMATNIWIRQQNRKKIYKDVQFTADESTAPDLPFELEEVMGLLIEILPPKQRIIFILSSSFDFSNKEIAEMVGTTEGTVKSYLHRARFAINKAVSRTKTSSPKTLLFYPTKDAILEKYIQAFNSADVNGLLALLDENATTRIVGDWEEFGKEQTIKHSLHYWSLEKIYREAIIGLLDDVPVVFGFQMNEKGEKCLREVIRLQHDNNFIYSMDWYYFSVDMIKYAAEKLGVPYFVQGYQYQDNL